MTTQTTVKTLAAEMSQQFETRKRDDGTEYVALKEGYPRWMQDVCHAAHGDMMPDDWRYSFIREAVDALAEYEDTDEARDSISADIYTSDLTGWLSSRADRYQYVDEVVEELGMTDYPGLVELLQMGQRHEKLFAFDLILAALEKLAPDQAEDDDAEADEDRLRRLEAEGEAEEAEADNESDDAE